MTTINVEAASGEGTHRAITCVNLLGKAWQRVFEVSKISLELAGEHNAEVLASCRKTLKVPVVSMFDLASKAFEDYVTLQKSILYLAIRPLVLDEVQGKSYATSNANVAMTNAILRSVDRTIAAQKSIIELTAKQARAASEQSSVLIELVEEDAVQLQADTLLAKEIVDLVIKQQPRVHGTPVEVDSDIIQLRVNSIDAEETVAPATRPKNTPDPSVH